MIYQNMNSMHTTVEIKQVLSNNDVHNTISGRVYSLIEVMALGSCASSMMFSHALVGHSSWEKGRLMLAS